MKRPLPLSLVLLTILCGCKTTTPREDVFVLDVSQSIDADAEQQMFVVVKDVAQHLRRGDSLTIIPITDNAEADLQARTLHYAVPTADKRQAYDADLRNLNIQTNDDLARLEADAVAHPGKRTDILGSIRVAMKEFSSRATDKRLIVLSDFIQDDKQFNFRNDARLATDADAVVLAESIGPPDGDHKLTNVVLGRLRSSEFSALTPRRQRAVNAFWRRLMAPYEIDADGTSSILSNPLIR